MTIQYEATKMYNRKKIIPVCSISMLKYRLGKSDTLDIRIKGEWIKHKPPYTRFNIDTYPYFTHSYHPREVKRMLKGLKYE